MENRIETQQEIETKIAVALVYIAFVWHQVLTIIY